MNIDEILIYNWKDKSDSFIDIKLAEVYAGSCYYEHMNVFTPKPFEFYTNTTTHYEYCLAGCCGAYKRGGINQCCDSTGATIGILIALVLFVGLVVTAGFVYRQKRRRLLLVNDVSSERDRLVKPGSPSNLSTDGQKQYQSHGITHET